VIWKLRLKPLATPGLQIVQQSVDRGDEGRILENILVLVTESSRQRSTGRDVGGLTRFDALNGANIKAGRSCYSLLRPM